MEITTKNKKRRVLLVNQHPYWFYQSSEYLLKETEDLRILHSNTRSFDWPAHLYTGAVICDFADSNKVKAAVKYLYDSNQFDTVVNVSEQAMVMAAQIRDSFSLEGMREAEAKQYRNKLVMKQVLQEKGVEIPRFSKLNTLEDISRFVAAHGKSVVKPIDGMGTSKTYIIEHENQIPEVLEQIGNVSGYEIEEFISGEMFHVDSVVVEGQVKLCSVSRYLNSTLNFRKDGYLASVMIDEGELKNQLMMFNLDVLMAFDFKNGVTHLEVFLSGDRLVFCEIAARAGGAGVIPSVMYAKGVNLIEADIAAQIQHKFDIPQQVEHKVAGWLLFHKKAGIVTEISCEEDYEFDWIYYKSIDAKRGDVLKNAEMSISSIAEFTITGTSEADVIQKINMIRKDFKFVVV